MTDATDPDRGSLTSRLHEVLDSPAFARVFALTALGTAFGSFAISQTAGVVAYGTMIAGLVVIGAAVLWVRRREIDSIGILPWTLIAVFAWLLVSTTWSSDVLRSLGAWVGAASIAFVAIVIAFARDMLQTARAVGDVLRVLLAVSLGLEILSGILLDLPIEFLGIQGNIVTGGGIQGLFGTRNMLGFVCVIALITFVIEWRTASVRRGVAVASVALAALLTLLSASATVLVLATATPLATAALAWTRHTAPARRPLLQSLVVGVVVVGAGVVYAQRWRIVAALDARQDVATRADLWSTVVDTIRQRPAHGWGFTGGWPRGEFPYIAINFFSGDQHTSALNAYLDVALQAGLIGLALFAGMCLFALGRSWVVAAARRSTVYAWTPLVLVALLIESMFESYVLSGAGLMILVICIVRAGAARKPGPRAAQQAPNPAR